MEIEFYRFLAPEAALLANLGGVQFDLSEVFRYCIFIEQSKKAGSLDYPEEAISISAVVRYARCFTSGVRNHTGELNDVLLAGLTEDLLEDHEYFLTVRNKHVAHSVNNFEEVEAAIQVPKNFVGSYQVMGVVPQVFGGFSMSDDKVARLKRLCEHLLIHVNQLIVREQAKLLPIAKSLDVEALKSNGISSVVRMFSNRRHDEPRKSPFQQQRKPKL